MTFGGSGVFLTEQSQESEDSLTHRAERACWDKHPEPKGLGAQGSQGQVAVQVCVSPTYDLRGHLDGLPPAHAGALSHERASGTQQRGRDAQGAQDASFSHPSIQQDRR